MPERKIQSARANKKPLSLPNKPDTTPEQSFDLPPAVIVTPSDIMRMQATYGNQAVQRWLADQHYLNLSLQTHVPRLQRTPDYTDSLSDYDDLFPIPQPELDEDYSRHTSQRRISKRLDREKNRYTRKLRFARSVDEIKQIQAEYISALDKIHTDADTYFRLAKEAQPDNLAEEQQLYADNMRMWAKEMEHLTDRADHSAVEKVVWNLYWEELKNEAVQLVIDAYGFSTEGAKLVAYHPDIGNIGGPSRDSDTLRGRTIRDKNTGDIYVFLGDSAFQNYPVFVHTIAHELEHLRQIRDGVPEKPLREFLSEAVELIGKDLPRVDIYHFFNSAAEALEKWLQVSPQFQDDYWDRFEEVRECVITELERVGYDEFTDTIDGYKAVTRPKK